ncbi:MAG: tRNA (guanosine(37)-N1)-methyltransferase TrmD [bacterium]|nr:tRNA (guanosine(37)-N1)-methyltransferase TrmD [bacterium]
MRIDILTLFPEMFAPLYSSIPARAQTAGKVQIELHNLRDYAAAPHHQVDDTPFGGGPGMVLKPEPLAAALQSIQDEEKDKPARVIYLSPQGIPLTQRLAEELSQLPRLLLVCGHYEGIDERIIDKYIDMEVSIGDYVLSNGELGAMVLSDAVIRLLDGVIASDSAAQESFSTGILDHPHYTKPAIFEGMAVPEVLLSGNHKHIEAWRQEQALAATKRKRPDLLQ